MKRKKNPPEKTSGKKNKPSSKRKQLESQEEFQRSIPGKRTPVVEKEQEKIVNEDEQSKAVNHREDNAQSEPAKSPEAVNSPLPREGDNEGIEAGDDNSEVHPRPPKVN